VDDLDRSIARRTAKNPRYPERLQAEIRRQRLIAALIAERKANHLAQALLNDDENWSGGFYELSMELGERDDLLPV
jgi:hypothetical protein